MNQMLIVSFVVGAHQVVSFADDCFFSLKRSNLKKSVVFQCS